MNSQCGSISPQTLKELIEYMVGYIVIELLSIFWKNSQQVAQVHVGYIVNRIFKETPGFFQKVATGYIIILIVKEPRVFISNVATDLLAGFFLKVISMYPLITGWSNWSFLFKWIQPVPPGFWLDKLLKKSQWNHNVNAGFMGVCPQCAAMYLSICTGTYQRSQACCRATTYAVPHSSINT